MGVVASITIREQAWHAIAVQYINMYSGAERLRPQPPVARNKHPLRWPTAAPSPPSATTLQRRSL
eukprot:6122902-Lingulodinium_polyedra.AAC.1